MKTHPVRFQVRRALVRRALGVALIGALLPGTLQCSGSRVAPTEDVATTSEALTRPAFTPPLLDVSAEVGAVPGSGRVGNDGHFRYQIPIELPEGRAGLAPSVALVYSSAGVDGMAGVGWTLSGFSSISRCSWINGNHAVTERIWFAQADDYCLDGQRTVLVSGNLGQTNAVYKLEVDQGVRLKIVATDAQGPTKWEVAGLDGHIGYYETYAGGGVTVSRYDGNGTPTQVGTRYLTWPKLRERDRSGNQIRYTYSANGGIDYPVQIDYTECPGCPGPWPGLRRVIFTYEDRPVGDRFEYFVNGARLERKRRLYDISVLIKAVENPLDLYGLVASYRMTYVQSLFTNRSLVNNIKRCDANLKCTPLTTFGWNVHESTAPLYRTQTSSRVGTTTAYLDKLESAATDALIPDSGMAVFDANGDGNDDVLIKRWPYLDANGRPDFTAVPNLASQDMLLLGDGGGFFRDPLVIDHDGDGILRQNTPCGELEIMDPGAAIPVDLNGDGLLELVARVNTGCSNPRHAVQDSPDLPQYHWAVFRWDSSAPWPGGLRQWQNSDIDALPFSTLIQFLDIDGDGVRDLAYSLPGQGSWKVRRARLTANLTGEMLLSYDPVAETCLPRTRPGASITVQDYDGDGREDLVNTDPSTFPSPQQWAYRWDRNGVEQFFSRLIEGGTSGYNLRPSGGLQCPTGLFPAAGTGGKTGIEHPADINGDGLKDVLYREKFANGDWATWKIRFNTGNGYTAPVDAGNANVMNTLYKYYDAGDLPPAIRSTDYGVRIGDFNGDRRDDILLLAAANEPTGYVRDWASYGSPTVLVLYSNGTGFSPPARMIDRSIANGNVLARPDKRWPFAGIGDVNGDGLADLIEFTEVTGNQRMLQVHAVDRLPGGVDLLTKVSDERGTALTVTMDGLSAGSTLRLFPTGTADLHVRDTHAASTGVCIYPAACTFRGRAAREFHDYRASSTLDLSYDYRGARVDRKGRGPLGFASIDVSDAVSGRHSLLTFDASPRLLPNGSVSATLYPNLGQPLSTAISQASPNTTSTYPDLVAPVGGISASVSTWTPTYTSTYPLRLTRADTATTTYQGAGSSASQRFKVTSRVDYDATYPVANRNESVYKDLDSGVTTTQRTTITTFSNDDIQWLIGRPTHIDVFSATSEDARDTSCTAATCVSSTVSYDLTYVSGTMLKDTVTRRHGGEDLVTRTLYGPFGGITTGTRRTVGTRVRETQILHDASGAYVEGVLDPAGLESWTLYDPQTARVAATIDPNGFRTTYTRDGFGRVTKEASSDGSQQRFQYRSGRIDGFPNYGGSWAKNYDAQGHLSRYRWSTYGNQVGDLKVQYGSTGAAIRADYGLENGTLTQLGTATYDRLGRPTRRVNGLNENTAYRYDAVLGAVYVDDPRGDTTKTVRDGRGLITQTMSFSSDFSSVDSATNYRYDDHGKVAVVSGFGPKERLQYDTLGRLTRWETVDTVSSPTPVRLTATYDGFGDVRRLVRDGIGVDFTYDADGRMLTRVSSDGQQTFVWDLNTGGKGRLTSATSPTGHVTRYVYDSLGRLSERREVFSSSESLSVGCLYDSVGRLSELRYPETSGDTFAHATTNGLRLHYVYGVNGQLQRLEDAAAGNALIWLAEARHTLGMLTMQIDANSIATASTYNPNTLRLNGKTVSGVTSGPVPNQAYSYEIDGQVQGVSLADGTVQQSFTYNRHGQLARYHRHGSIGVVDADLVLTHAGGDHANLLSIDVINSSNAPDFPADETFTSAGAERLTSWSQAGGPSETITYDSAGRIFTTTGAGGLANRRYTYNSFNLPTQIVDGSTTYNFTYDAFGNRVRKAPSSTTNVAYVGDLYEQRTLGSATVGESIYRVFSDEGIVAEIVKNWSSGAVTRRMFQTDLEGSPVFQTTGTTSSLLGGFSPYGRRIGPAPKQLLSNYGYTGHRQDDDLGLIDMKGRVYDTRLRRFLTRDPVLASAYAVPGGHSAYAYTRGNPTNLVDPTGLDPMNWDPGGATVTNTETGQVYNLSTGSSSQTSGPSSSDQAAMAQAMNAMAQAEVQLQNMSSAMGAMAAAERTAGMGMSGPAGPVGVAGETSAGPVQGRTFDSAALAARAALHQIAPTAYGRNVEYGGLVYRGGDGQYAATPPVTQDNPNGVDVWKALSSVPAGATIVGDYHIHTYLNPDSDRMTNGDSFSGHDLKTGQLTPEAQAAMTLDDGSLYIGSTAEGSDYYEAQKDLITYKDIIDPSAFTSYLATPSGTFGVYFVKPELIIYFQDNQLKK